jgi:tetratricopeptide (TPR) repeat protein
MMAAALSLVAGLALSTYFGVRAVHDRDEARRRAELAQAVNAFLTEDLLGRGNPAKSGKAEETLMEAAEAAEAGIDRRLSGEPLVAGAIYLSLARAFESRGAFDAARTAYGHAIEIFGRAGAGGQADALIAFLHQASMEVISGQPGSLARAKTMIAEAAPRVAAMPTRQAEARVWLQAGRGTLEMLGGDVRVAQNAFRAAADMADTMPDVFDEGSRLSLRQQEAFTCLRLAQWDSAKTMMKALLARRLVLNGPRHTATLQLELNLAQVRIAQGEAAQVLPELNRLLPDFNAVFGPDHQRTMTLLATRATALAQLERYDEAAADDQALYRHAVSLQGPNSYFAIGALSDAADAQCRAGNTDAGLETARTSTAQALQKFGATHVLTQMASGNLAMCLIIAGDFTQAAPLLDKIDTNSVAQMAVDPHYGAEIDVMRAAIAQAAGDKARVKALLEKTAPAFEKADADKYFRRWAQRLSAQASK